MGHGFKITKRGRENINRTEDMPVNRNRPFSLKELCRLQILKMGITEDGITKLEVPEEMKIFFR